MSPRGLRRQAGLSLFIYLSIKEKVNPSVTAHASLILGFFECHLVYFFSVNRYEYCKLKNLDEQKVKQADKQIATK